jgi:cytoskeletal protein RodZ
MHTPTLTSSYSRSMALSFLIIPQSTSSATEILSGTPNTYPPSIILHHLNNSCNSLRRRTHLLKRKAETAEDAPKKRSRPLPGANGANSGRAVVGGVGINGLAKQAPGRLGRGRSTGSSSSSSDTSSDSSSDDTSSSSDSTSGSSSDSDSDSDSTSPPSSHVIAQVVRPLRRAPPSFEPQGKSSQPRHVTSTLSRIYLSTVFVPQACLSTAWIWEAADPQTQ